MSYTPHPWDAWEAGAQKRQERATHPPLWQEAAGVLFMIALIAVTIWIFATGSFSTVPGVVFTILLFGTFVFGAQQRPSATK